MSEMIHKKDKGTMRPFKSKDTLRCSKCGYIIRRSQIHQKFEEGILEIPI